MVKPYGNIGDMKNDGFDKSNGIYYQVFSPENIEKDKTIYDAVNKMEDDFIGLFNHWQALCPIKVFNFVINDKYKGIPALIHQKQLELNKQYTNVEMNLLPASKLEDVFLSLSDDDIIDIVNFDPSLNIESLDYSILTEAVEFILGCEVNNSLTQNMQVPDFYEKIEFNGLSDQINHWLTNASYSVGDLDKFFRKNSEFAKQELRNRFNEFYLESKVVFDSNQAAYSDQRFIFILEKSCHNKSKQVRDSVLVLMACFFESCDIFENPGGA